MKAHLGPALVCVLGACGGRNGESQRSAADSAPRAPDSAAAWTVGMQQVGAIRYGMTIAEARVATGDRLAGAPAGEACGYVAPAGAPAGFGAMVEHGRIVRVDVDSVGVPTDRGALVGMTEGEIRRLYPDTLEAMPHKYDTAGRYLIVVPTSTADSGYRIIFELGGDGRVLRYRAGLRPAVEYVERCG